MRRLCEKRRIRVKPNADRSRQRVVRLELRGSKSVWTDSRKVRKSPLAAAPS